MRITNKMMTNNMMYNINKNKTLLSKLDEQYATGKKIQRPSEDPIVAVRALKLRTNLSELNQYYEKNIPDAKSWMDVTESALTTINEVLTSVNTYCVQGTSDTLTAKDRTSIVKNLGELKHQIYQEGDTNYAGRYVFTGYKTDTSLIFDDTTTNLHYQITETFTGEDIDTVSKVKGQNDIIDYNPASPATSTYDTPTLTEKHRIRLSYDDLTGNVLQDITYKKLESDGSYSDQTIALADINTVTSVTTDPNAYNPTTGINYIPETGELVLSDAVYQNLRLAKDITVNYEKKTFQEGDLRPEHYFNCRVDDTDTTDVEWTQYKKSDQQIQYEINFNQKLTINTQGSDAIKHAIGRDIDEILKAVQDVTKTEDKIAEVDKMLKDSNVTEAQKKSLNTLKEQLNTELVLKNKIMQEKFEHGITGSSKQQDVINIAVSDLGSRYVRLQLTESRLSSQQVDFEDLLSTNEDADLVETVIKYQCAETLYNASLSAASKVVQNTLLDFL